MIAKTGFDSGKCDRKGRYHVHKLIEKYGRMGNMSKWLRPGLNRPAMELLAQMLSDLAVIRPAAPCLESTATQHYNKRGASMSEGARPLP